MKLRVVTATMGDSPFLPAMLQTVAQVSNVEHIVICPAARIAGLSSNSRIRLIPESSAGLYAALDQALRVPGADWDAFTWINDDDLINAEGLAKLVDELSRRREIGVAYGRVALIDGRGRRVAEIPVARYGDDLAALLARGVIPLAQPGTVIRRSVWERVGGFDLSYRSAGDLDFFVRAVLSGTRFVYIDTEAASFRLRRGQLSKLRQEVELETARALLPLANFRASPFARWRFCIGNASVYLERLRRHGFVSMRTLYERTE